MMYEEWKNNISREVHFELGKDVAEVLYDRILDIFVRWGLPLPSHIGFYQYKGEWTAQIVIDDLPIQYKEKLVEVQMQVQRFIVDDLKMLRPSWHLTWEARKMAPVYRGER